MFVQIRTASPARRFLVLSGAIGLASVALFAQSESPASPGLGAEQLDPFVTTATRTRATPQAIGSALTAVSAYELNRRQIDSLGEGLALAAAAPVMRSGAPGSATSVFLRGANSNQTLFLVDGIRLNDPNTDYQAFLGGATLTGVDTVEVLRGAQSTLYGADAIGGVIALRSSSGTGVPGGVAAFEGGSFGTAMGLLSGHGESGTARWNAAARVSRTDNDRPNNRFDSANVAFRFDRQLKPETAIGATLRWYLGRLGSPGDSYTNDPNDRETESNLLVTAFADLHPAAEWTVHVIVGGQDRRYVADTPAPNPPYGAPTAKTIATNRRLVGDAQATYAGLSHQRLTAGTTGELNQSRNTGFGAIDRRQEQIAVFAQDEVTLTDDVYVTGGLRYDRFDTFGGATTGRATFAWLPIHDVLKLRSSYGTGFRSPSFLDLYGQDPFYLGNEPYRRLHPGTPQLNPEHARSFDGGIDYYLPGHRGSLSATWFQTDFRDLIDYKFDPSVTTVVNIGRARTSGVELTARTTVAAGVEAILSYTYLDAYALSGSGHTRLLRRPRHTMGADVNRSFGAWQAGAGVQYVGRRDDYNPASFSAAPTGGYALARVYGRWDASPRLSVKARIENLLDRRYEAVTAYPALGLGAFGSVEWRF